MNQSVSYSFETVEFCNMCNSSTKSNKILGKRLNQSQGKNPKTKIGIAVTVLKCKNCGLLYSNPIPIPANIQDHYNISAENYWSEDYAKTHPTYFNYEIAKLKKLMPIIVGMKSLDIGAGVGKSMIVLKKIGFNTFGLEASESFYNVAINKMKIDSNQLLKSKIEDAEYPENTFDFITFGAVLEHLYSPSNSIKKAVKWLKPSGIIHIEVPSSNWLIARFLNLYFRLRGTDYVSNLSPMHAPYHLYEFNLKSFKEHALQNNYEIAFYEYYVCETFLPKFLDPILKPLMKWTNTGMQLAVWLRKKTS